ncbi:hypothetical protein B6D60_12000 [candidate division KSB1 bacterium 4484_87]|nr:MAG: hypothetical protein B6D60_12000 [candidate division KSB1 bacterium 4484_87]
MRLIIFEDEFFDKLYPISYLRPVFELKCGTISLRERIEREFKNPDSFYFMRDYLVPVFSKKFGSNRVNQMSSLQGDDLLIVNGRLLALDIELASGEEGYFEIEGQLAFIFVKKENLDSSVSSLGELLKVMKSKLPNKTVSATMIDFPWNLVQNNSRAIKADFDRLPDKGIHGELSSQAAIVGDKNLIHIAEGASVRPFVTLDTTNGPIIIDKNAIIHPMTHIEGPNYTGENTYIFGGNIREGCSFGPVCRLHGEIEESIIHGYSNKHHDGFLGHAYLGEWVNLGAFTTNSDLKNDYSSVQLYVKGELTDSEDMKVGSFIGDHTKTSIGTIINTGAMIGVMSNVVGSGKLIPKFVPSFCWYLNDKVTKGRGMKKMIETSGKAMSRRGVEMTAEDEEMFRVVYELTKEERTFWIKKSFA